MYVCGMYCDIPLGPLKVVVSLNVTVGSHGIHTTFVLCSD